MNSWLFLRGAWDERTQKSIDTDDDMWLQLFAELVEKNDYGNIYFNTTDIDIGEVIEYTNNCDIATWFTGGIVGAKQIVFSRGGFDWQVDILKKCPTAYKIRYGAGKRFMPEPEIDYQLVLVDTEKQRIEVLLKYPKANVHLLIKPAASHFKPIKVGKEYDVCYIANGQQAHFKGIEWVYNTAPSDISILHLGYPSEFKHPDNVTCRRVDRINMPAEINKCRIGIVPYDSIDSCPRVIPEMLACGLYNVIFDETNCNEYVYCHCERIHKKDFWDRIKYLLNESDLKKTEPIISKYYQENLSIPIAAQHIKDLIKCG